MGKREILTYVRGWCTVDEYKRLHNPSRIDWLFIRPLRCIYRWWAYWRRYGFEKGLAILALRPLIRSVVKEIEDHESRKYG